MIRTAIVVEDCRLTLEMTKFILARLGVEKIFTATSANEFERLISVGTEPDLVITDWNIELNFKGSDVIAAVEKLGKPIAVVSSEEAKPLSSQRCHWFKKPLNLTKLEAWLKTFNC